MTVSASRAAVDPTVSEILERSLDASVLTLRLNRPRAGNSLSLPMIAALQAALDDAAQDDAVHVIVLEAAGGKVFCAGHDLGEVRERNSPAFAKEMASRCSRMMQTIVNHPRPVIAKVRGVATAAGAQLVASCDLAFAADDARFATPGVNIGLWCITPMVALSRAVSRKHAMQMLLTGRLFDAQHAFRIGLVNEVVAEAQLDQAVRETALEIASKSTFTVALGKQSFYRQADMGLSDAYEYASELVVRNLMAEDAVEGISAFVEKRQPVWKGR